MQLTYDNSPFQAHLMQFEAIAISFTGSSLCCSTGAQVITLQEDCFQAISRRRCPSNQQPYVMSYLDYIPEH